MTSENKILPITNFINAEGELTDDPTEAVAAVAGEAGEWHTFLLTDFTLAASH